MLAAIKRVLEINFFCILALEIVHAGNKMKEFKSVDDYIASQPTGFRPKLELIRQTIKKIVPEAEEVISYGMPAFRLNGMLTYYAAFKNHYSFFFGPAVTAAFKNELKDYETSKATIKIPAGQPVPVRLLTKLTKYAVKVRAENAKRKAQRKTKK